MAAATLYQELTDIVTCEICFEEFEGRDPRSLPCLHSFCKVCIQSVLDVARKQKNLTSDIIPCPVCQSPSKIPEGDPCNLPAHFASTKIQDVRKLILSNRSICHSCETTTHKAEVTCHCFQCNSAMCFACKVLHDSNRRYQNHVLVNVTASTIAHLVCQEHDKHLEAFCVDCGRAVCSTCSISEHHNHQIYDLGHDTEEGIQALGQILADADQRADQTLRRLNAIQVYFNSDMDQTQDQLDKHHDDVIKQLRKQHRSFCDQLQQQRQQANHDLDRSKAQMKQAKVCINKLQRQTDSWKQPIPEVPDVKLTKTQDLIADIKLKIPSSDVSLIDPNKLVFTPLNSTNISLGRLSDELQQESSKQPTEVKTTDKVSKTQIRGTTEILSSQQHVDNAKPASEHMKNPKRRRPAKNKSKQQEAEKTSTDPSNKQKLQGTFTKMSGQQEDDVKTATVQTKKHKGSKKVSSQQQAETTATKDINKQTSAVSTTATNVKGPRLLWSMNTEAVTGLDVLLDGNIIVTSDNNEDSDICVYSKKSGQKLNHELSRICNEDLDYISVNKRSGTITAIGRTSDDKGKLYVMQKESGSWGMQTKPIITSPSSVVSTDSGLILVGAENDTIREYNQNGKKIWQKQLSYSPDHMTMDHRGNFVVVSDHDSGCLRAYDTGNGMEMFTFKRDTEEYDFNPGGICVNSNNNIIVANESNKSVSMFDTRCNYWKDILKVDGIPRDVAMYGDSQLAVLVEFQQLQLYEI